MNTVWSEGASGWYTYNQIQPCFSQQIYIVKDTLFNGVTYHQLGFYKHDRSGPIGCLPPWQGTITTGTYGYFRNDSINKKVWLRFNGSNRDTLMYDFNLTLGDTLPPFMFRPDTSIRVTQIDTIILAGKTRKRFLLGGPGLCYGDTASYLIEGIGGTSGFTLGIISSYCAGYGNGLGCMKTNGNTVYPDSSYNCNLITSISTVASESKEFKVYPNPSSGNVSIILPEQGINRIQLFDISGRLLKEIQNTSSNIIELNIEGAPEIYFLQAILRDGQTINQKIVKQ